MSFEINMGIA